MKRKQKHHITMPMQNNKIFTALKMKNLMENDNIPPIPTPNTDRGSHHLGSSKK